VGSQAVIRARSLRGLLGRSVAALLGLGAAGAGVACSLPAQSIPPYDAATEGDAAQEGSLPDASADATQDSTAADSDATAPVEAGPSDGGQPEATASETGVTEAGEPIPDSGSPPDAHVSCDSGCLAYVVSDNVSGAGVVTVISTEPLAIAGSIPVGSHPSRVAFTPDGHKAYVTETGDGTVTVIDTSARQVTKTIAVATPTTATLRDVAVSPDGKYAYVSDGANARIDQIDTSTDTLTATHVAVTAPGPYGLAFSPDGSQLWAGGAGGNAISRFSYPALTPLGAESGVGGHMLGDRIVFRPDFSAAFVNSGSGCPCCGEFEKVVPGADAGTYVGSFNGGWAASGYALAMDPGGAIVYATSQATPVTCSAAGIPGSVWILDATTDSFSQLNQIPSYDEPRGLALSADGTLLLVAGYQTGGASPGVQAYSTMIATPQGSPLAMPGLPQDIVLQP